MNAMTTIDPASGPLTMSSREIAELTGKNHRDVLRDIRVMLREVDREGLRKFAHAYVHPQNGQKYTEYLLPKNLTLNLVTGYRSDMRLKIIDRWLELEEEKQSSMVTLPDFSNPAAAARAWADEVEAKEKAQALVTYAQEVVEKLEPYARVGKLAVDQ